jgi:uncharacterized membrane protein
MDMPTSAARLRNFTLASITVLAALLLAWELWLAPARPGGSLLALKAVPLLAVLPAIRRGQVKAYQWWSMLILLYVCEGVVRGMSDATAMSRWLGWIEFVLASGAFGLIILCVRAMQAESEPSNQARSDPPSNGRASG